MKRPIQVFLTLAIVLALASIGFTLGTALTGRFASETNLGTHLSYMSIASFAIMIVIVIIDLIRTRKLR